MNKIFFPYNDQPRQFSFKFSEPIRFPFYVNDLVYYWEVEPDGVTLYLLDNKINPDIPIVKDILLEETGISTYLINGTAGTSKDILAELAKIGWNMDTLELLDDLTLGEIDRFTLGEISICYANWMEIASSVAKSGVAKIIEASDAEMKLKSDAVLPYIKDVYLDKLDEKIGIVGLNSFGHITIGELDSRTVHDIDAMLSTFRIFNSIPALLVKEIRITQNNLLNNNVVVPLKDFCVPADGINCYISSGNDVDYYTSILIDSNEINCCISCGNDMICLPNIILNTIGTSPRLSTSDSTASSLNKALGLTEHCIGIKNSIVLLEVTVDSI